MGDLIARLQRGSKIYNGGSVGPTGSTALAFAGPGTGSVQRSGSFTPAAGLAFEPGLAGQERGLQTQLEELIALTGRNRSRTGTDFSRALSDLSEMRSRDIRDLRSSFGGRNLLGSTPGVESERRLGQDFGFRQRDLETGRERGLADIETGFIQGSGRLTDALAEIARQRGLVTQQRDLERAQTEARNRALTTQLVNKVPLEGINEEFIRRADPGTVLKYIQRQLGRK